MKIIIFILLAGFIYARDVQKPDSLVSIYNNSVNANIISIDDNIVRVGTNKEHSDFLLKSIDQIFMNTLGEVYNKNKGFIISLTKLQKFLNSRYKNAVKEEEKFLEFINKQNERINLNSTKVDDLLKEETSDNRKWSFSIIYSLGHKQIENYDFILRDIKPVSFMSFILEISKGEFESELTYKILNNLQVATFLGYSIASLNRRLTFERGQYQTGTEEQKTLNIFLFEVGLKYYLGNLISNNVTAFIVGTIGKQNAFANTYFKSLFIDPTNNYITNDNGDSFIENLYSPWLFTLGFGTEYFFNKSFSIFGLLRYSYSEVSSEYHSNTTYPNGLIEVRKETVRNAKLNYRTGLGINFYF